MNPDPAGQALLNMQLAVAIGKGVQLDAEQTAAVLARIEAQSEERAAVVAWLRSQVSQAVSEGDLDLDWAANAIERGVHRKETT